MSASSVGSGNPSAAISPTETMTTTTMTTVSSSENSQPHSTSAVATPSPAASRYHDSYNDGGVSPKIFATPLALFHTRGSSSTNKSNTNPNYTYTPPTALVIPEETDLIPVDNDTKEEEKKSSDDEHGDSGIVLLGISSSLSHDFNEEEEGDDYDKDDDDYDDDYDAYIGDISQNDNNHLDDTPGETMLGIASPNYDVSKTQDRDFPLSPVVRLSNKKRSSNDDFQMRIKYNGNDDNNKSRSSGRNWPYFPHDKNNNSDVEANLPLTLEYASHQAYLAKLRQKHQQQLETLELEQDYGDGEPDPGMADLLPKINSSLSHDTPKSDLSDVSDNFLHQRQDGIDRLLHEPTARGKFLINSIPMTSAVAAANSSTEAHNQSPSSSLRYSLSNDKTCREEERREIIRRMSSHNLKTPSAHNGPMPNVRTLQLDIPTAAATVSLRQQSQKQLQLLGSNGGKRQPAHLRLSNSPANSINDHSTDIVVRDEPFKIFILLLQPRAKIFELIQVIYSPTLTTVGDIIDMIPTNASEPALGNQQYIGLCRPCNSNEDDQQTITDFSLMASSSSFYNNPTNHDRYGSVVGRCAKIKSGEIFIALLPRYSPKQMISYGTPILQTDQVMRLMDRSDPLKLIQLSSLESKIALSSSLSATAYDKDNDNKYQEYGPTKMITTNNRLVETREKGKTIIRNILNDKKTDHGNTKIIRGTAIAEKIKVCESSDGEEEYDA